MADGIVSILIQAKDAFSDTFKGVISGMDGLANGAAGVAKGLGIFAAGAAGAAAGITVLAVKGSEYNDFQSEFNRLAGTEAPAVLAKLKDATLGATSEFDLFNVSNRLMNQGLSAQSIPVLADFADRLKETTNQFGGVTDIMNSFGSAIATGRVAMVEQMGITVDNKKAMDDYAASLGLVDKAGKGLGSQLDAQQQKFATSQAILQAVSDKLKIMPKPTMDAEDAFKKMNAELSNTTMQIGAALSPAVTQLLGSLNGVFQSIQPLIPVLAGALVQAITALTPIIQMMAQYGTQLATMFMTQLLPALMPLMPPLTELMGILLQLGMQIITALMPVLVALIPLFVQLLEAINPLLELILPPLVFLLKLVADGLIIVIQWISLGITVVGALASALWDGLGTALQKVKDLVMSVIDWFKSLWDWAGKIVDVLGSIISKAGQAITSAAKATASTVTGGSPPKMASGGIVTSPLTALIGEAGPEAVIPLDKMPGMMGGNGKTTIINVTIDQLSGFDIDEVVTKLNGALRGLVRSA